MFSIFSGFFEHLCQLFESGPRVLGSLLQALLHFLGCFGGVRAQLFGQLAKRLGGFMELLV